MFKTLRHFILLVSLICSVGFIHVTDNVTDKQNVKVVRRATYLVVQNYYDQSRIKPRQMLEKGLFALVQEVPEALPVFGANSLKFRLGHDEITIPLKTMNHLYDIISPVSQVFTFLENNYKGEIKLDEMEHAFVDGMLEPLDPHSRFFPPVQNEEFQSETDGKYGGLGIVIGYEDYKIHVISPVEDTPAWRAGIKAGDVILQIDDNSTVNMTTNEAVDLMRGDPSTKVTLKLLSKDGQVRFVTLTREVIAIQSVEGKVVQSDKDAIGVLRIKGFQGNTMEEFYKAIEKIMVKNPKGMVIDLRNNSGGLLQTAMRISDRFLSEGDIVATNFDGQLEVDPAHAQTTDINLPLVVVVNEFSASAAEIVAGALKNNQRAIVIGRTSFGKGSVQQVYDIQGGSSIKMTVAEYLTPGNKSIQAVGIIPDVYLYPTQIKDKTYDLKENVYYSEKKLESHFENKFAATPEKSLYKMPYFKVTEEEDPTATDFIIKIKEDQDYELQFAIQILKATASASKADLLKATKQVFEKENVVQAQKITEELKKEGLDWQAGQSATAPTFKMTYRFLDKDQKPTTVLLAGQEFVFEMTVTNTSSAPVKQVLASVDSLNSIINNKEFVFGAMAPGETKTQTLKLEVPHEINNFEEKSTVHVYSEKTMNDPSDFALMTNFKEKVSPQLSYAYQFYDGNGFNSQGNQNGLPEVGEKIALVVKGKNLGPTASEETMVSLRNESKSAIFLQKARDNLGNIAAGTEKSVTFEFDVKALPEKNVFEFDFYAMDNLTQASLLDKISLDVKSKAQFSPKPDTWQKTPVIAISEKSSRAENIYTLVGEVSDEDHLKDMAIYVEGKKMYFEDFIGATMLKKKEFKVDLPLQDGLNSIVIKARGNRDLPALKSISVVYNGKDNQLAVHWGELESPQDFQSKPQENHAQNFIQGILEFRQNVLNAVILQNEHQAWPIDKWLPQKNTTIGELLADRGGAVYDQREDAQKKQHGLEVQNVAQKAFEKSGFERNVLLARQHDTFWIWFWWFRE